MIRLGQDPKSVRPDLNKQVLFNSYTKYLEPEVVQGIESRNTRYSNLDTNFQDFAENRSQGVCTQTKEIFIRNCKFLLRDKKSFASIFFNSLFISLIMLSVYHGVGKYPDDFPEDTDECEDLKTQIEEYQHNTSGMSLNLANQLTMSASFNVVFQVPLQIPVLKRELGSKMYVPSAYYIGRFVSNILIQMFYPIIMITTIFLGLGIDHNIENYSMMMLIAFLGNFVFCGQGYFMGTVISDENQAKSLNMLLVLILFPTSGVMVNLDQANIFVKAIADVSPLRYVNEAFFTVLMYSIGQPKSYNNCSIEIS